MCLPSATCSISVLLWSVQFRSMYFINKKILNQTVQTCVIVGLCRHSVVFSVTEYVTNVLEDARVYCAHAKKKNIDLDDVKLAVQMQLDQNYTTPPPRDVRYSHTTHIILLLITHLDFGLTMVIVTRTCNGLE